MWISPRKNAFNTVVFEPSRPIDRTVTALAVFFAIPPAIGTALAVLRVTGGESLLLSIGFGLVVGLGVGGFVVLLAITGRAETPPNHIE